MTNNVISIKGNRNGLVFYFNTKVADFKELSCALEEKLLESDGFLQGANYFLQPDTPFTEDEQLVVEDILQKYQMKRGKAQAPIKKNLPIEEAPLAQDRKLLETVKGGDTQILTGTIRSGKQYSIRGNLVLLGDLNVGAEIFASGSIIILGSSRGLVHAGAEGDENAIIVISELLDGQIRLADKVLEEVNSSKKPLIIAIKDEALTVAPYETKASK